jgi:eukaryotic-like serine/threonine-protein kinase
MSLNKLGRYDIIRVLGKGAMGLVYEARDPNLDRRVAIKTIKVENLSEEAAAEYGARFRTEARSAARLQHPHIVSVYDSDRHGDMAYLVMEFIQGEDLKHHLDSGRRYSLEQSLGMVRDLLSALEYAHRQNIVHRDVKPANLLIEADGRVKLTDFGVARIQDSGEATRTQGSMVGTLKYMSPEQVQGQPIDARADLFAVGIVLYQLLTGKRPFDGDTDFAIIQQIVGHTPAAPSSFNALLPPAIDAVLARALAKKRDARFATAQDFALALQEAGSQISDPTIVPPASRPGSRGGNATDTGLRRSRAGGSTVKLSSSGTDAGSTVTQELELVYWKDIKESDDLEDLEGFLDKFPAGIYADLARRRLKKLGGAVLAEDSGTGAGTATMVLAPAAQSEWTRLQAQQTLAPAAAQPASTPARTDDPDATRIAVPAPQEPEPPAAQPEARAPLVSAAPRARPSKMPLFALAAVAVLMAVGIAFKLLSGASAPADVASPALASQAPAASPAPPKLPPKRVAAAVAEKPPTPKPAPAKPAAAETAAVAATERAPAPAAPSNPRQACENRILLGFQICMNEQCAKSAFSNHPVCVERRAMDKMRQEAADMRN